MSSAVNVSRINGITRVKVLPHFYLIEKVISTPWQSIAQSHQPKMIVGGASSYPRLINYERLREIG